MTLSELNAMLSVLKLLSDNGQHTDRIQKLLKKDVITDNIKDVIALTKELLSDIESMYKELKAKSTND